MKTQWKDPTAAIMAPLLQCRRLLLRRSKKMKQDWPKSKVPFFYYITERYTNLPINFKGIRRRNTTTYYVYHSPTNSSSRIIIYLLSLTAHHHHSG